MVESVVIADTSLNIFPTSVVHNCNMFSIVTDINDAFCLIVCCWI